MAMIGARAVAVYIAAQMRAKERVADALVRGGFAESDQAAAQVAVLGARLEAFPARVEWFHEFMGPPVRAEHAVRREGDRVDYYRLDLWPDHEVAVLSNGGFFGGFDYRPVGPPRRVARLDDLNVWSTTEAELLASGCTLRRDEEWYPRRDYYVTIRAAGGRAVTRYAEFDFGLLQAVLDPNGR